MSSRKNIKISDNLTDEDWKCIETFKKRMKELLETRMASEPTHGILAKLEMKANEPMTSEVKLPHGDDLRAFISVFRFFYLKKEPCNFYRVLNILKKRAKNSIIDQAVDNWKAQWSGENRRKMISLKINDRVITTSYLLDVWFNAHYFHNDDVKQRELDKLKSCFTDDFAKFLLATAILDCTNALISVYNSIKGLNKPT